MADDSFALTTDELWWKLRPPSVAWIGNPQRSAVAPDGGQNTDHVRQSMATTALALLANGSADSRAFGGQHFPWDHGSTRRHASDPEDDWV